MFVTWIIVFFALLFIETVSFNLVTIWFALGSLVAAIVSIYIEDTLIQFTIFFLVSLISLILTKPLVKKFLKKEVVAVNLDRIIGMKGIATEDIDDMNGGEVKVDGKRWSAYSSLKIKKNSKVKILSINGVKLEVMEWEEK